MFASVNLADRKPSTWDQLPWIYAENPEATPYDPEKVGKWLLFVKVADVDEVWTKIAVATEARRLGVSAKVATAWDSRLTAKKGGRLICVYTGDIDDHEDVTRVLIELRNLGFGGRLSYKADEATLAGRYGQGSAAYVSQPDSLTFEDRRG